MSRCCALILALLLQITAWSAASSIRRPFRSIKATRETVENYEQVLPVITLKDGAQPYPTEMTVEIPTQSHTYTVTLKMNHLVMSPSFTSMYFDQQGREVLDKTIHANCYYQGEVEGHPDWTAIFSACHGLQGEFGLMEDPEQYFHLEPMDKQDKSMQQVHAFYLDSEYKIRDGGCASGDHHQIREMIGRESLLNSTGGERLRRQSTTRFVEWVIVNDARQFAANGNSLSATVSRALSITNGADTIFRQLGIRITLTRSTTFTTGDRFTVQSEPEPLLDAFTDYVRSSLSDVPYDSIMLITGIDITENIVGIAFIGTMCRRQSSTGLSQDGGRSLSSLATTVAHELGHIFNMNHDENRGCTCADTQCVMSAVSSSPPPTRWSSCSIADLNVLIGRGGDSCLFNTPTEMVGDPVCGNGIRENNEACDCGSPSECTDSCCDAVTCQLAAGAECSGAGTGCCTSQCQFQPYGTQCRSPLNECDVAEYCSGNSGECPQDDQRANGVSCNSNTGYCFDGRCPSHNAQCLFSFGTSAGPTACFNFNTRGQDGGNCGHTSSGYIPCSSANVMCGLLQCNEGTYQNSYSAIGILFTLTTPSGRCNSFDVPLTFDGMNPGLVEEGSKCGEGSVCSLQRCVALSTLSLPTCPSSGGQQCSGASRGVCNNRGTCSCNVGFTGSACETVISTDVNECLTNNGGCAQICSNTVGSFECSCNSGFILDSNGRTCTDINECVTEVDNCGQTCTNTPGSFTCSCRSGYTASNGGRTCTDINECVLGIDNCDQTCTNTLGSFTCSCRSGYTASNGGRTCTDIDECVTGVENCDQTCTNTPGSFTCSCRSGYTASNGGRTCTDIDECVTGADDCDQTCTNTQGSFTCGCRSGYTASNGGRTCTDIDECALNTDNCPQTCTNTPGGFTCGCGSGFTTTNGGSTCTDIDECAIGADNCDQTCTNTQGSFTCSCRSGYAASNGGRTCTDIDECAVNSDNCQQTCTNTDGGFTCSCRPGFLPSNGGATCLDVDECASEITNNCAQTCTNTIGSFTCSCRSGFSTNNGGRTCMDINECANQNGGCAETCTNMQGSFSCSCPTGFQVNGLRCDNINECAISNGGCDQLCVDTEGSFMCECEENFVLQSDDSTCAALNQCLENPCQQLCARSADGMSFSCSCRTGFTLQNDGISCDDIDECAAGNGGCEQTCSNTPVGSFACGCNNGFVLNGDQRTCSDLDECSGTDNGNCSQNCNNTVGSFQCGCDEGYLLDADGVTCNDINECTASDDNAGCVHLCTNTEGSFACSCNPGFSPDGKNCTADIPCANTTKCSQFCSQRANVDTCSCGFGFELSNDNTSCLALGSTNLDTTTAAGGVAVGAIAGGIVVGIILLLVLVGVAVLIAVVVVKKKKGHSNKIVSPTHKNYTYSNGVPYNSYQDKVKRNISSSAEDLLDRNIQQNVTTSFDDSFASDDSFEDDPIPYRINSAVSPPLTSAPKTKSAPSRPAPGIPASKKPAPPTAKSSAPLLRQAPAPPSNPQSGGYKPPAPTKSAAITPAVASFNKPSAPATPTKPLPYKPAPVPATPTKLTPSAPTKPTFPPAPPTKPTLPPAPPSKPEPAARPPPAPKTKPSPPATTSKPVPADKPQPPSRPTFKPNVPEVPSKPVFALPATKPHVASRSPVTPHQNQPSKPTPAPPPKPKPLQSPATADNQKKKPIAPPRKP